MVKSSCRHFVVVAVLVAAISLLIVCGSVNATNEIVEPIVVTTIQLDIEPYTLSEWTSDRQGVANQFLDLIDKLLLMKSPIPLRFAIPRWFDSISITRNGLTKYLSQFIQDRANLMIMDYVNSAQRAINDARNEIEYGHLSGTTSVIGLETMQLPDEPTATYYGKNSSDLENDLQLIDNAFSKNRTSYEGLCIHDWKNWKLFTSNFTKLNSDQNGPKRDLYVWDNSVILVVEVRNTFLNDLKLLNGKIRRIYLESEFLMVNRQYWNITKSIIQQWNSNFGIQVELISGDSKWALTANHGRPINFVNSSIAFYQSLVQSPTVNPTNNSSIANNSTVTSGSSSSCFSSVMIAHWLMIIVVTVSLFVM